MSDAVCRTTSYNQNTDQLSKCRNPCGHRRRIRVFRLLSFLCASFLVALLRAERLAWLRPLPQRYAASGSARGFRFVTRSPLTVEKRKPALSFKVKPVRCERTDKRERETRAFSVKRLSVKKANARNPSRPLLTRSHPQSSLPVLPLQHINAAFPQNQSHNAVLRGVESHKLRCYLCLNVFSACVKSFARSSSLFQ